MKAVLTSGLILRHAQSGEEWQGVVGFTSYGWCGKRIESRANGLYRSGQRGVLGIIRAAVRLQP